jgi:GxxExxY protein
MIGIRSDLSLRSAAHEHLPESRLTGAIIGAFYDVYNDLKFGLHEHLYGSALAIILEERGFRVRREVPYEVVFHERIIGLYRADFGPEPSFKRVVLSRAKADQI